MKNKKNSEEIVSPITINIDIDPEKNFIDEERTRRIHKNLRIIGDVNNLIIREPGEYEVQIFLNEKIVYTIPFSVEKSPRPIPEGR